MPTLADVGRSNIGKSLGDFLSYIKSERQSALQEKRMGMLNKLTDVQIQGSEVESALMSKWVTRNAIPCSKKRIPRFLNCGIMPQY